MTTAKSTHMTSTSGSSKLTSATTGAAGMLRAAVPSARTGRAPASAPAASKPMSTCPDQGDRGGDGASAEGAEQRTPMDGQQADHADHQAKVADQGDEPLPAGGHGGGRAADDKPIASGINIVETSDVAMSSGLT